MQRYCKLSEMQNKLELFLILDKRKRFPPWKPLSFSWGTRTRTKNDRTRICSVTITPYPNESLQFSFAGAKVLLFLELPQLFGEKIKIDIKKRDSQVEISFLYSYSSLFSASIALIFSRTRFISSFSFWTLRFISSIRLLPFFEEALRKPRLFS